MQRIITGRKYEFIPPYPGRFLAAAIPHIFPFYLRKTAHIKSIHFTGEHLLSQSLLKGNRIILAPNHSRSFDPLLIGILSGRMKQPFHYMANWHIFLESKAQGWIIRRLGGFSVNREGVDRKALQTASEILLAGKRPLVIFPEGEITRTNDYLCPFMRGFSFIIKASIQALKKQEPASKIVVHPVAIKYILAHSDEEPLHQLLNHIEDYFHWTKSKLPLLKRIVIIGKRLLALHEIEHLGGIQRGEISSRIQQLKERLLSPLENEWLSGKTRDCFMSRVNSLRTVILREILKDGKTDRQQKALEKIDLAVRLSNYPPDYLREDATLERMAETIERLQEDALPRARPCGPWEAKVRVGEEIEINADEAALCQLPKRIAGQIQTMLDFLRPKVWVEPLKIGGRTGT